LPGPFEIGDAIALVANGPGNYTLRASDNHAGFEGLVGGAGNDTLIGSDGQEVLVNGGGVDSIAAGGGNDNINLDAPLADGSTLDGGDGIDKLEVSAEAAQFVQDPFSTVSLVNVQLSSIEQIAFDSDQGEYLSVAIDAAQIGNGGISETASLIGGDGIDNLFVYALTAGDYTLPSFVRGANWDEITDRVFLIGVGDGAQTLNASADHSGIEVLLAGAGNSALNGSDSVEYLVDGAGTDTIHAGGENDRIFINSPVQGAEIFDGGAGTDMLVVTQSAALFDGDEPAVDLTGTTVNSIEQLQFGSVDNTELRVLLTTAQIGGGLSEAATLTGGAGDDRLLILAETAGSYSLDDTSFTKVNWTEGDADEPGDVVELVAAGHGNYALQASASHSGFEALVGGAGNDTLIGGDGSEILIGGGGVDSIVAGGGDDSIEVDDARLGVGSVLDGGEGIDKLEVGSASAQFTFPLQQGPTALLNLTGVTLNSIEQLELDSDENERLNVTVSTAQIGGGLSATASLIGGDGVDTLVVQAQTAGEYTLASFIRTEDWDSSSDVFDPGDSVGLTTAPNSGGNFTLNASTGHDGVEFLIGGAGNDVLNGSDGAEILNGGAGTNSLNAGGGDDLLAVANGILNGNPLNPVATGVYDGGNGFDYLSVAGEVGFQGSLISIEGIALQPAFASALPFIASTAEADLDIASSAFDDLPTDLSIRGTGEISVNLDTASFDGSGFVFEEDADVGFEIEGDTSDNQITGTSADDEISGDAGNDTLTGGAGDDTLDGGTGIDRLFGGAGNDILVIDTPLPAAQPTGERYDGGIGTDILAIAQSAGASVDTPSGQSVSVVLASTELSGLEGVRFFSEQGTRLNVVVRADQLGAGLSNSATLFGGDGDDSLSVLALTAGSYTLPGFVRDASWHASTDVFDPGDTVGLVAVGSGNFTLNASATHAGIEALVGGAGNDTLNGSAGSEILNGNGGVNILNGGGGNDLLVAANTTPFGGTPSSFTFAGSAFNGGAGFDYLSIGGAVDFKGTISGIEGLNFQDAFTASAPNTASQDAASLDIGAAAFAGMATDLHLRGTGDIFVVLAPGNSFNGSGFVFENGADVSFEVNGSTANDSIIGTSNDDDIEGLAGNDTLNGGAGTDTLSGGAGNDLLVQAGATTGAEQYDGGDGIDTLRVSNSVAIDTPDGPFYDVILAGNTLSSIEKIEFASVANTSFRTVIGAGQQSGLGLVGGAGTDLLVVLTGGAGSYQLANYTLTNWSVSDAVILIGGPGDGYTLRTAATHAGTQVLVGNDGDDHLFGGVGTDILLGNAGDDTLSADDGTDTMTGGAGNDVFVIDGDGTKTITDYTVGEDLIDLSETGFDSLASVMPFLSQVGANVVLGAGTTSYTFQNVTLADLSADSFIFSTDTDPGSEAGTAGADALFGAGGADSLTGLGGNDTLTGFAGNDTLDGGAGIDRMVGGTGDDVYVVDVAGDVIVEDVDAGADTIRTALTNLNLANYANVENLTYTGTAAATLTGTAGNNVLTGGAGNDTLNGGDGTDTLNGGGGNDLLVQAGATTGAEQYNGGDGTDTLRVTNTVASDFGFGPVYFTALTGLNSIERIEFGSVANTRFTVATDFGSVELVGGAGDDQLSVYAFGAGTYQLPSYQLTNWSASDTILLAGVQAFDYTLKATPIHAGIEILFGNSGDDHLFGGVGTDILLGNAGDDTLSADDGTDTMTGGAGNDVFVIDGDGTKTITDFTVGEDLIDLSETGFDSLASVMPFLSQVGANVVLGAGTTSYTFQNVTLADLSADSFIFSTDTDPRTEAGTAGADFIFGGAGADSLTGSGGNDTINGFGGNDTLDGGAGVDSMTGGAGDDVYVVDVAGDVIVEDADAGSDSVTSSVNYTLGANVENLELTGAANVNGTGNGDNNVITGNGANNSLTGNAGDDTLDGGLGNDTLTGGTGADSMIGGAGNDSYVVDDGGDVVVEGSGAGTDLVTATIDYSLGDNVENLTLTPGGGDIDGTGNALANVINGNEGANALSGGEGNDTLNGLAGNDTMDGGAGADSMSGGLGDDHYIVDAAGDLVVEAAGAGTGVDSVEASISYTLGANVENLILDDGAVSGTGNALNNVITGNDAANTLSGAAGADTMAGGLGDDAYVVDAAGDVIVEDQDGGTDGVTSSFNYSLGANVENLTLAGTALNGAGNASDNGITGNAGNNSLSGGEGDDTLSGAAGNDTLDGGLGADSMTGGAGNDVYLVDDAGDAVAEDLAGAAGGTDTVRASIDYALGGNVENLTLIGTAANGAGNAVANQIMGNDEANSLSGGEGNDTLNGGAGEDTLDGGAGNDQMIGGVGSDSYIVDSATDVIIETTDPGTDMVEASVSYTLAANVENLILTGSANINGAGNALNNLLAGNDGANSLSGALGADTLDGGDGNDTLDGGAGVDSMTGGAGDDRFVVDSGSDVIVEEADGGVDTVSAASNYTLGANVENLVLTGTAAINGEGNALGNMITGNGGVNSLSGGGGDDTIDGGLGGDTLEGGAGADSMIGGAGNDSYVVDDAGDQVIEGVAGGTDMVSSSVSYTLGANVENLTLSGSDNLDGAGNGLANMVTGNGGANHLAGDAGADTLNGGAGDDTLDGGAGADRMIGGVDDDLYVVDTAADIVVENANEGIDTASAALSYTLGLNVENLELTGTANINGAGNGLENLIIGNGGNNSLGGAAGNDTLEGGAGNDTLDGGAGTDSMIGGAGNDSYIVDNMGDVIVEEADGGIDAVSAASSYTLGDNVENLTLTGAANVDGTGNELGNAITGNGGNNSLAGEAGNDTLSGGAGVDTLDGGEGNDTLDGGLGGDSMTGGAGNDIYVVDNVADSVVEQVAGGADTVNASISYALADNIENLTLTGSGAISGTGNADDNLITGNAGANTLNGADGQDTLVGGLGSDKLNGGSGDDVLDGGAGADTMAGGVGNDSYTVDAVTDVIVENAGEGTDSVTASVSYTLSASAEIETLELAGTANINGTGNGFDNVITGNSGNNALNGAAGDDVLEGGDGNDTLDGGTGGDTLDGGSGNDLYVVDDAADMIIEQVGGGTDAVSAGATYTLGDNVENLTLTGTANVDGTGNELGNAITGNGGNNSLAGEAGNDTLSGGAGADMLDGGEGNDTLDGGTGADTMTGGAGDDSYVVDNVGDVIVEDADGGTDTVSAASVYTLGANIENLTLTGAAAISGTGNANDNVVTGNAGANTLNGLGGSDSLSGGAGNDTLNGGTGNDTLDGGAGVDSMTGGEGDDHYVVDAATDMVKENAGEGLDTVSTALSYTLGSNVENLELTGAANVNGAGNGDANLITGNSGNNLIDGKAGADTMAGGAGNDSYVVDNAGDVIVEQDGGGSDGASASVSYALGDNVENLTLTGSANIDGSGNDLSNVITGNGGANILSGEAGNDILAGGASDDSLDGGEGNDTLDGGLGADAMAGGGDDDVYAVDNAGDVIVEQADGGVDLVNASVSHALSDNVENLTLTGAGAIDGVGNGSDNIIIGNGANNSLSGGDGADTLTGNAGNDTLEGGAGADSMTGGAGNDTYFVDSAGDQVVEAAAGGVDTVNSSVSHVLSANVESLTLTGGGDLDGGGNALANGITGNSGANHLTGDAGNDTLSGGAGDDTLDGGAGADRMVGGAGDDHYIVDAVTDVIVENAGEGSDSVTSSVTYTLSATAEIENLELGGSANINGTGNGLNNSIIGNSGNNVLTGNLGNDSLTGAGGNDTLSGGAGNDTMDGGAGADRMVGGAGDDLYVVDAVGDIVTESAGPDTDTVVSGLAAYTLGTAVENLVLGDGAVSGAGNALNNVITGNAGANTLDGGAGSDTLDGGDGADSFQFSTALGATNVDTIASFDAAVESFRLSLNIFQGLSAGTLASDAFAVGASASDASQRILYDDGTGSLYFDADGSGAASAQQFASINSLVGSLSFNNFVLY